MSPGSSAHSRPGARTAAIRAWGRLNKDPFSGHRLCHAWLHNARTVDLRRPKEPEAAVGSESAMGFAGIRTEPAARCTPVARLTGDSQLPRPGPTATIVKRRQ